MFFGARTWGSSSRGKKKYAAAEAEYRRAAELDPNNATRHAAVGDRLVEQMKYKEAEVEYRRAVALEPNNARWRDYLGYALIKQQKWSDAEIQYREAARLDPSEPRYQELLKEVSGKASEKRPTARTNITAPLNTASPNTAPPPEAKPQPPAETPATRFISEGDRLVKDKKWGPEAEAAYKQAARLAQNNPVLHTKLAIALSAQQKDAEAEAQHREAVRIEPNKGLWHFNLGVVLDRQGKVAEAEAELREAVRLDPKNVQYRGTWKKVSDTLAAKTPEDPGSKNYQRPPAIRAGSRSGRRLEYRGAHASRQSARGLQAVARRAAADGHVYRADRNFAHSKCEHLRQSDSIHYERESPPGLNRSDADGLDQRQLD